MVKHLKAGFLRAINSLGYTVIRIPPRPQKTSDVVNMVVAGKTIKIHGGNPLRRVYELNPQCNSQMAEVAALVEAKYPSAWAVDVGANVGDTLAILRSRTKMPILCVEGDTHCFGLLQENARQFDNVQLLNAFLSNESGSERIQTEREGWNTTLVKSQHPDRGREIKFETLDEVTARLKCQSLVKLLKVDTEGYDMRIVQGAKNILSTARPVLTWEMNKENIAVLGDDVGAHFDYLTGLGYRRFFIFDPDGKPICILGATDRLPFLSLYEYSGPAQGICYFDVWAFHQDDEQLFHQFLAGRKTGARDLKFDGEAIRN